MKARQRAINVAWFLAVLAWSVLFCLVVLRLGLDRGATGAWTAAYHEEDPCWDYGDCDGYDRSGGDGGSSGGHQGYGGGGGRSGDYDGGPGDDCRNACGNTIIVPGPGQGR